MDSDEIRTLQTQLNEAAARGLIAMSPIDVDGILGEQTTDALKLFQQAKGLEDDGRYGPETKAALLDALGENTSSPAPAKPKSTNGLKISIEDYAGKKDNKSIVIYHALDFGMKDKNELAMYLAQLDHESCGFSKLEEDLRYTGTTLMRLFASRVKNINNANIIARGGPQAVANCIYQGRMGNTAPGDGYKYRGRGFIQLTGKDNYARYARISGIDILENPDRLFNPEDASVISISFWTDKGGLEAAARAADVRRCTYLINGGYNGLDERQSLFKKYLAML